MLIQKLRSFKLKNPSMEQLRQMLIGTYDGYMEKKTVHRLDTLIRLSFLLGKEMGKEELRRNTKNID